MHPSLEHEARPNRSPRQPGGGDHPAAQRSPRPRAECAAARGYITPDDSESEEERAAGGPGPEPSILSEH